MTDRLTFAVDPDAAGARLDKWIADQSDGLSRARVKALIEDAHLTRDREPFTDPSWKIREGETFALSIPEPVPAAPEAEPIPLDILFEDDDLIVLDKPAGLVVHPAAGNWSGTLVNALLHHCGDSLSGIGGVARPGIVHRLDKETSGVMVVAKHDAAHRGLTEQFAAHEMERAYLAICHGSPRPAVGTIDRPIARAGGDRKKMQIADTERRDAKAAITHYRRLSAYGAGWAKLAGDSLASLIECRLETGRTHQIRVHMSSIGHPLVGDPVYGREGLSGLKPEGASAELYAAVRAFRRQALHARQLGFVHPMTGETLAFETEPPEDFTALAAAFAALDTPP
jgi:23S rRNA pseudouridine1911/1915/1917 synthase